ncbi:Vesicle-associated membrane protein [Spathaspora sp. JA1]|nr:Vesicle-associated membrane protein [Spathaspora sp. JA1]
MNSHSADLYKHLIHVTLTVNSTTLYTYENHQIISNLNNLNCSELISQELGLINSSKTLIGSIPLSNINIKLLLYFIKKLYTNPDGSRDLITVVIICHHGLNKPLVLTILKSIMDKYIEFRQQQQESGGDKSVLGEFKLYMNQIIKYEEMNYDSNRRYGATDEEEQDPDPNQLLLANEEVEEVRQLMLDNINKLLSRGDKINLLVDQTDRLNTSSVMFQRKAQSINRKMWINKFKFIFMLIGGILLLIYLVIGSQCGFPLFGSCRRP